MPGDNHDDDFDYNYDDFDEVNPDNEDDHTDDDEKLMITVRLMTITTVKQR